MTRKWKVWKRDGAWWVLDNRGRLRYSSGDHTMALSFALMQSERRPVPYITFNSSDMDVIGGSWHDFMKRIWEKQQRQYDEDDPEQ